MELMRFYVEMNWIWELMWTWIEKGIKDDRIRTGAAQWMAVLFTGTEGREKNCRGEKRKERVKNVLEHTFRCHQEIQVKVSNRETSIWSRRGGFQLITLGVTGIYTMFDTMEINDIIQGVRMYRVWKEDNQSKKPCELCVYGYFLKERKQRGKEKEENRSEPWGTPALEGGRDGGGETERESGRSNQKGLKYWKYCY